MLLGRNGSNSRRVLLALLLGCLASSELLHASDRPRVDKSDHWTLVDAATVARVAVEPRLRPLAFRVFELGQATWLDLLRSAPLQLRELPVDIRTAGLEMLLPMPDGSFARFRVMESPIMAPELAAKFPEFKTYVAQGIDDPRATARLDWTLHGFHAQILSPGGAVYIDPYFANDTSIYVVYYKRDYPRPQGFSCQFEEGAIGEAAGGVAESVAAGGLPVGPELRTYRLAVAATGEYTQFHGGTVDAGMAAIVTAVNRVNGIYEVEVAVHLKLIANNNLIVYTNGATDPYSNGSGGAMLGQNQTNLTAVIGSANYDIGHVFSTGGGGVASLGVICSSSQKARGVTGLPSPIGDPFYVDYVAHEMGHQFGALHSFNGTGGSCGGNRSGSAAYEPGSGSTIMAYAGICGADNLQLNSDAYFHSISFDQIRAFTTTSSGNSCAAITATGNSPPVVGAGVNYAIPAGTPFVLTAAGSDPDSDPLTYCWEERDLGPAQSLVAPDNGSSPLFRSLNPTSNEFRYLPELSDYVNGNDDPSEEIPSTNRTMQFRVTARDNRAGGGGVNSDEMTITVRADSPPFVVTFPSSSVNSNGPQLVEWDVGDTASSPINSAIVDILLSTDAGATFPTLLAADTPNDGSETVMIPDVPTDLARIMVRASDNVFYAVSGLCPEAAAVQLADVRRNRFLSIQSPNVGRPTGIRVHFTDLPNEFGAFEGEVMWVGPPIEICENSGQGTPPPGGCAPAPGLASPFFFAATLQCTPYYTDWGAFPSIQVHHHAIIPDAIYTVDTIDELCDTDLSQSFSPPTVFAMPFWGDTVSNCATVPCGPPNGVIDASDVVSILNKFRNAAIAPAKARVDLEPGVLDFRINVSDITIALGAFSGDLYPFLPASGPCP